MPTSFATMPNKTEPSICLAQLGARRHYAVPSMLHAAGMLQRMYTDLHAGSRVVRAAEALLPRSMQPGSLRRLTGRRIDGVPAESVRDFPLFGLKRLFAARRNSSTADRYSAWVTANRRFGELVCAAGFGTANTVYVFNGAGLEIVRNAKQKGLSTVVEQTAADQAFEESLLAEEREKWPGWEPADVPETAWRPMADREEQERLDADLVICGSDHVLDTVRQSTTGADNCTVVPYGFRHVTRCEPRTYQGQSLNVFFAGTLCLRKGVPYLTEAAKLLAAEPRVQVRAAGPSAISADKLRTVTENVEYVGTVPRAEMQQHYDWADVFVLPTLSEGSANVCYEALAAGLPVIATPGAGSVVRSGLEGFIIPPASAPAIAEHVLKLLKDPELCRSMSEQALARAAEFTWERYAERLVTAIREQLCPQPQTA